MDITVLREDRAMTLTQKQRDIYLFIRRRIQSNNPPSVREIQAAFGIASPNGCMSHLKALQKKGMIDWDRKEHSVPSGFCLSL